MNTPVRVTWSSALDLSPGEWRLFADFTADGGEAVKLGADLSVAGGHQPRAPLEPSRTARVDDYTVTLDGNDEPGSDSRLTLSVTKDGVPVTDLQPYLGAYDHLVALRDGDLAYLHVHPDGAPGDGTPIPAPRSSSMPPCRAWAAAGCIWTASTNVLSATQSSLAPRPAILHHQSRPKPVTAQPRTAGTDLSHHTCP